MSMISKSSILLFFIPLSIMNGVLVGLGGLEVVKDKDSLDKIDRWKAITIIACAVIAQILFVFFMYNYTSPKNYDPCSEIKNDLATVKNSVHEATTLLGSHENPLGSPRNYGSY